MARRSLPPLKRRSPIREPRQRFTLFCEGERTEPAYFRALKVAVRHALIDICVNPAAGVPYTIAEEAAKLLRGNRRSKRNSYETRDEVWAVFDRDKHPRYEEAVEHCRAHGVKVARSNPCFEVWLILHEQDYNKPDGHKSVQAYLQSLRPEYRSRQG